MDKLKLVSMRNKRKLMKEGKRSGCIRWQCCRLAACESRVRIRTEKVVYVNQPWWNSWMWRLFGCVELFLFSSQKLNIIDTPTLVDATVTSEPLHNRHSIRLRISALSTADIDAVVRDLDALCADVVQTYTVDDTKYNAAISSLTDTQVACSSSWNTHRPF